MFDTLSDRLTGVFDRLRGRGALNESDVREAMREVRVALLEADVDLAEEDLDIDEDGDSPDNDVDLGGDDDLGVAGVEGDGDEH